MRFKNDILWRVWHLKRHVHRDGVVTPEEQAMLEQITFNVVDKKTKSIIEVNASSFDTINHIVPSDQENIDLEAELEASRRRGNL